jgi:hypothetical protein
VQCSLKTGLNGWKSLKIADNCGEMIAPPTITYYQRLCGLWQELKVWHVPATLDFVKDTNETVEKPPKNEI